MIAAGAGHEIGKHRLLSDGVCAPWGGGKTPQGKGCLAAGQKNLKKDERSEVSSDCVIRNPNKSTSKSRISSNAQCREPKRFCFRRFCTPGAGREAARQEMVGAGQKIWENKR